jgi:hypothetical protein
MLTGLQKKLLGIVNMIAQTDGSIMKGEINAFVLRIRKGPKKEALEQPMETIITSR